MPSLRDSYFQPHPSAWDYQARTAAGPNIRHPQIPSCRIVFTPIEFALPAQIARLFECGVSRFMVGWELASKAITGVHPQTKTPPLQAGLFDQGENGGADGTRTRDLQRDRLAL